MAIQFGKPDSSGQRYFEITYKGFEGGLNVQEPETEIPDNATPSANNFQVRNKELRSRPPFALQFAGMDSVNPGLGLYSFLDVNNVQHTVGWNTRGLWQLAPTGQPPGSSFPWAILGGPNLVAGIPVVYQAFGNVLYYTNGGTFLASWDGITTAPTASNLGAPGATSVAAIATADAPTVVLGSTGPLSFGGLFIGELNNQILLANISLVDNANGTLYNFPNRLWWSANGIPTQFDPTANTSAGFNDFLDVPDSITGLATVGVVGYLFRTNGITFFSPTGNSLTPFQFDHLWASNHGIGNVYPWSIHSYGSIVCFISVEQIYQMGVSSFEPIGGKARDAIMADLALASNVPTAAIVPTERLGYVYLTYRISIPLTTFTRHYWYSIEDKNWMAFDTPGLLQTGRCEEVWTGTLANLPLGSQPPSAGVSGGSSTGSGSSGGGGGSGGLGGGGGFGCFSGNVRVFTPAGLKRFDELPAGKLFDIINKNGVRKANLIVHVDYSSEMLDMGEGNLVTPEHGIYKNGEWIEAEKVLRSAKRIKNWNGVVYNLHIVSESEDERHFILENGLLAHNNRPVKP